MLVISEPLAECLTLYPRAKDVVAQQLNQAFQTIGDKEFRDAKDRICLFKELMPLLEKIPTKLDKQDSVSILEAVLKWDVDQVKAHVKGNNAGGGGRGKRNMMTLGIVWSALKVWLKGESYKENIWDDLFQRAADAAGKITDSQFLTQLGDDVERFAQYGDLLQPSADKAKERAFAHLEDGITKTTNRLTPEVRKIKEQDFAERIKHEQASRVKVDQRKLMVDLIRQVNNLSTHTAHA